jgi:formyltetrahydrofolate hydrolase
MQRAADRRGAAAGPQLPDRHGIVAAVASFFAESGANITSSDQYSDRP